MEIWFMIVAMFQISYIVIILADIRKELEISAVYNSRLNRAKQKMFLDV